ncbi:TetR/AcrR family transcriptional regulator [Sorangium sp. So ce385]|uniref:TetR/AcrR family transcriptional regulator n=1 Tax=Sorangium sp. So ce385 TaxID=3133308 RepID=UPI003F5B8E18
MGELRERKKRETRQRISDVATELFFARGFDAVTVEEIAAAADVSKMTVFNYFARKEDLLLDREDEVKQLLREAIGERPQGQSPLDALRRLVDRLCEQKHPFARIDSQTVGWWRVVAASPSLKARLREIGDEVVEGLAIELAGPKPDGLARLVAGMVVLTWRTAYGEGIRVFERGGSAKKANAAFIALIDRGFAAVHGMAAGSSRQTSG